jgi:predicted secreted hydrolase
MRRILPLILAAAGCLANPLTGDVPATVDGFSVPQPGHRFVFPRDDGSHPDFRIEWWYVTGHLFAGSGRRFGFQATFFRQAAAPGAGGSGAPFGDGQVFLAHMALLDVASGRFISQERLNREGWDAGAARDTLDVRNGNWSLRLADPTRPRLALIGGVRAEAAFALSLVPLKPLVIFGENGVSRKGAAASAASYYLTFSRLRAEGELGLGDQTMQVTGEAWMDHEISSSQLGGGEVGWDWVGLQLRDGREIMLYRLRRADGTMDPASALTWVDAAGRTRREPFMWEVLDRWQSPASGADYPARVRLTTTDPATQAAVSLTIEPLARDQELAGSLGGIPYWEGACRIRAADGGEIGSGYLELTGYAHPLKL